MGRPPVICIVDDDADVRASLRSFLRAAGLDARVFDGAANFLASTDRHDAACVITDLHMPGIDGLALTREIQTWVSPCPIIVITGFPTPQIESEAVNLGAAAFLQKPVDPEVLLARLEAVLT